MPIPYISCVLALALLCPTLLRAEEANQAFNWSEEEYSSQMIRNYTFGYWLNGWRKDKNSNTKDVLCYETGYYGILFDIASLDTPRFGLLNDDASVSSSMNRISDRIESLPPAELIIELEHGGMKYRMKDCLAGRTRDLSTVRTEDNGVFHQHYAVQDIFFYDEKGERLPCIANLDIRAWPKSLTFTVDLTPKLMDAQPGWNNATLSMTLKNGDVSYVNKVKINGLWECGETKTFTLNCAIDSTSPQSQALDIKLKLREGREFPVAFDPAVNAYTADIPKLNRDTDAFKRSAHYDDFIITLHNASSEIKEVPFHLRMTSPLQGTGLVGILCYPDGTPTGIEVQGAKFYDGKLEYYRPYMLIPVKPGITEYLFRISYLFYGTAPSASINQDAVEWGGNTRWFQMTLGGPGEIMTLDGDHGLCEQSIADVRALFLREGKNGELGRWTDAGWGGDWLRIYDTNGQKVYYGTMKTRIHASGPCFTDIEFKGYYGEDRAVKLHSRTSIFRTDDYSRVWFDIRYEFLKNISAQNSSFFMMTKGGLVVPKIAYGAKNGLIKEHTLPEALLDVNDLFIENVNLREEGPWWVTGPENHRKRPARPVGYSALIVRSVDYRIGKKKYNTPTFSFPVARSREGLNSLEAYLVPPEEVKTFTAGDSVHLQIEWIMLPREADDYYGPNTFFRKHLEENPRSWKTTYREALGNDLKVDVKGGQLINRYPIMIDVNSPEVTIDIEGGVGYVPLRLTGLRTEKELVLYQVIEGEEIALDQSSPVGNDFWQTEYDIERRTYTRTYNLCLDGMPSSRWVLK